MQTNKYELSGDGVRVSLFLPENRTIDLPSVTIEMNGKRYSATTRLSLDKTQMGTWVTTVIEVMPDRGTTLFSVLIPAIDSRRRRIPDPDNPEEPWTAGPFDIKTIGIQTLDADSIVGPPPGVQQFYTTYALSGTATFVPQR